MAKKKANFWSPSDIESILEQNIPADVAKRLKKLEEGTYDVKVEEEDRVYNEKLEELKKKWDPEYEEREKKKTKKKPQKPTVQQPAPPRNEPGFVDPVRRPLSYKLQVIYPEITKIVGESMSKLENARITGDIEKIREANADVANAIKSLATAFYTIGNKLTLTKGSRGRRLLGISTFKAYWDTIQDIVSQDISNEDKLGRLQKMITSIIQAGGGQAVMANNATNSIRMAFKKYPDVVRKVASENSPVSDMLTILGFMGRKHSTPEIKEAMLRIAQEPPAGGEAPAPAGDPAGGAAPEGGDPFAAAPEGGDPFAAPEGGDPFAAGGFGGGAPAGGGFGGGADPAAGGMDMGMGMDPAGMMGQDMQQTEILELKGLVQKMTDKVEELNSTLTSKKEQEILERLDEIEKRVTLPSPVDTNNNVSSKKEESIRQADLERLWPRTSGAVRRYKDDE